MAVFVYGIFGAVIFIALFNIFEKRRLKELESDDDLGYLSKLADDEFMCDFHCQDNYVNFYNERGK